MNFDAIVIKWELQSCMDGTLEEPGTRCGASSAILNLGAAPRIYIISPMNLYSVLIMIFEQYPHGNMRSRGDLHMPLFLEANQA